jgi:hypothetical protein
MLIESVKQLFAILTIFFVLFVFTFIEGKMENKIAHLREPT